ncbi:hypothetical protein I302_106642 [Kwoniella bestiolae CBS 10118]|uniref:Galactose oxidase n=1 Tax=Kwoniella bestiolae CBS 10118 TaxID=1296100 RepID=A0AAJ8M9C5_9TREE
MSDSIEGKRRKKRQYTVRMENIIQHGRNIALLVLLSTAQTAWAVNEHTIIPRWGHAAAYIPSPPTLIMQGGKTDPSSSYTYSSSPNTGETLILPLSSGFSTSSPPFTSLDTPSAPTSAWHTLTPLSSNDGSWQLLSFGGDGGTSEAVQTGSNSAWIMDIKPDRPSVEYTRQASGNGQPMRRIYHSTSSASQDGKVYMTGGLKDDGSGTTFSDVYSYDSGSSSFSALPSLPVGLYHHSSLLLPNGTVLALGGAYTSPSTGSAAVQPYSTVYSLDTTSPTPTWSERQITGKVPEGRRGASLALSEDGSKAFLFGGANARLGEVYGDGWEFNLGDGTWKEVTTGGQGPGARYDHSAVGIGGSQIAFFGGYGDGEPADSSLHIWDTTSNTWITDFTPVVASSASASTSSTASSGKSAATSGISTSHTIGTKTRSSSGSDTTPLGANADSCSATASSSSTTAPTDAGAHSHPLTLPIRIGLILGIIAFVALLVGIWLWRYLRRRKARQAVLANSSWPASGPRGRTPSRPYGSREKGGEGLMEELSPEKPIEGGYEAWGVREKGASVGLGMGAIGATLHSISSKFSGKKEDPYTELHDDPSQEVGGPLRKSSRRIGDGIRLLGPRPQREKSLYYSPEKPVRKASMIRNSRIDMLREEDIPNYAAGPISRREEDEDWVIDSDESGRNWKSAKSLLKRQTDDDDDEGEDPFHDRESSFDDDAPILPPMRVRGGPVPTPHDSRSDLGTFDEIASMSNLYSELSRNPHSELSRNPYSDVSRNRLSHNSSLEHHLPSLSPSDPLDLAGLLVPPSIGGNRYSQSSIPTSARSGRSGQSNALSDAEEGIISEARYVHSQSPTLVSPSETPYVPIKRSESFFRRLAAGGITSLLSSTKSNGSGGGSGQKRELDIRDPAPQPTLWPVMSNENVSSPEDPSPFSPQSSNHPPTSWRGDTLELPNDHGKGPSLSSLNSARSMRDMVLVQRETTSSSVESEAIIERSSSPVHEHRKDEPDGSLVRAEENDSLSPLPSETSTSVVPLRPDGVGHHRHANGYTDVTTDGLGMGTPEEIVFNGADFASPPILPTNNFGARSSPLPTIVQNQKEVEETPRKISLRPIPSPITPRRAISRNLNTTVIDESSLPPSGSPVPSPLVQHRRPVRDVVNSINKRGSSTPFSLLSPMSNYSPAVDRRSSLSMNVTGSSGGSGSATPTRTTSVNSTEDPFGDGGGITPKPVSKRPVTIHGSPAGTPGIERIITPSGKRVTSVDKRPTTMWEVIKKEQLRVANPDQCGGRVGGSGNS